MPSEGIITEETTAGTVTDEINQAFDEMAAEEKDAAVTTEAEGETTGESIEETAEETTEATETTEGEVADETVEETSEEAVEEAAGETDTTRGGARSKEVDTDSASVIGLTDALLERAVEAGISLGHARKFDSEAQLLDTVEHYEKVFEQAAVDAAPVAKDPFADLPTLDPEVHDAGVIEKFDRLTEIIKQEREVNQGVEERLKAVEGHQGEASQATQRANTAEAERWFNGQISGLGKDFFTALGEGDSTSLDQNGSQFAKREGIAKQVSVMYSGYDAQGLTPPPRDELFATAARSVLHDEFQKQHNEKLSGDLKKRAGQHIERVGGRKISPKQSPHDYAVAELEAKFGIEPGPEL